LPEQAALDKIIFICIEVPMFLSRAAAMPSSSPSAHEQAKARFREHGGVLSTTAALRLGVHPRTLYALRDGGELERLARGLYRLADLPPLGAPDLVTVALAAPKGVICLISALAFHELTDQSPHVVDLALPRGAARPRLDHPPLRFFWFGPAAYQEGVQTHALDGMPVHIYGPEKTIADSFKYRHRLGLDIAVEALRRYQERGRPDVATLLRAARACRVERVMRPYLEALL
jgi:predicted transcriptional regulator of viral defense system